MRQLQALHQQRPDPPDDVHDVDELPKTHDETAPGRSHNDVGFPGSPYGGFGHDDRAWNPPVEDDDTAPGTGDEGGTG